ncbi:MAG: hypothetical protein R3C26_05600 [Calditrichia bacterium]
MIRETAREIPSQTGDTHSSRSPRDLVWRRYQRVRAGAILNALLGSWGRRGGFYYPNKASIPKYKYPKYPIIAATGAMR